MKFRFEKLPRVPSPAFPAQQSSHVPFITVGLARAKKDEPFYVLALIDSGAADTIFHADIGRQIGIPVDQGPTAEHRGVGGQKIVSYFHHLHLTVGGYSVPIYAGFSDQVQPKPGLLGIQGFFDHFKVSLDLHKELIELTPYPRG